MSSEHFCLKWNNFQSNIVTALGNLKLDEDFVDVTLSCEGRTIKAHKVILSACSHYFRDVFRENPCNHPIIILKDTQFSDLESLVKYVYQGQVYISQDHLSSFLKTADALQIKGLAEQSAPPPHPGSGESSPMPSPVNNQSPTSPPENKILAMTPPTLPPSQSPVSSYPSQSPGNSLPRASPIKIPTVSHLKRSNFTNLAQYLSGSLSSPPLNGDHSSSTFSKRRKTTPPAKRYELPHYSGSTSTASPGSPPHSHSTEGGEPSLEIGEESDSSRSIESNDLVKPSQIVSDYEYSTKEPPLHAHSPYHNRLLHERKEPEDFSETLDLSKTGGRHTYPNTTTSSTTTTTTSTIPVIPSHISGGVLEAALTASDPMASNRTMPSQKRIVPVASSSTTLSTPTLSSNSLPPLTKDKDGQGISPSPPTNNNNNNSHPRNRWRCMQPRLCNYCWKTFSNSFNLKQHIVNVHVQSQGVSCSLCDKVVKNKWYLRKHLVTAHGAPLKRVKGSDSSSVKQDHSSSAPPTTELSDSDITNKTNNNKNGKEASESSTPLEVNS